MNKFDSIEKRKEKKEQLLTPFLFSGHRKEQTVHALHKQKVWCILWSQLSMTLTEDKVWCIGQVPKFDTNPLILYITPP